MDKTQTTRVREKQRLAPPKRWGVFLLNDDYTPMDFVVDVLQEVFGQPENRAYAVMMEVHLNGKGLCGVYTRDIAETKQQHVLTLAAEAGHPLMCTIEEVSS